jgi:hypothetical protein
MFEGELGLAPRPGEFEGQRRIDGLARPVGRAPQLWAQADRCRRSIGAPQFEQFTAPSVARSSAICAGVSGRTKSFSRRKSRNVISRPWSPGHRR